MGQDSWHRTRGGQSASAALGAKADRSAESGDRKAVAESLGLDSSERSPDEIGEAVNGASPDASENRLDTLTGN